MFSIDKRVPNISTHLVGETPAAVLVGVAGPLWFVVLLPLILVVAMLSFLKEMVRNTCTLGI